MQPLHKVIAIRELADPILDAHRTFFMNALKKPSSDEVTKRFQHTHGLEIFIISERIDPEGYYRVQLFDVETGVQLHSGITDSVGHLLGQSEEYFLDLPEVPVGFEPPWRNAA